MNTNARIKRRLAATRSTLRDWLAKILNRSPVDMDFATGDRILRFVFLFYAVKIHAPVATLS